jgi:hypothetical protein
MQKMLLIKPKKGLPDSKKVYIKEPTLNLILFALNPHG